MNEMVTIRSLGRQLSHAGEEIQSIAEEIDLMKEDDPELVEVYNDLLTQHLEKAQVIVLTLTQKLFGLTDEGTRTDEGEGGSVFAEGELNNDKLIEKDEDYGPEV